MDILVSHPFSEDPIPVSYYAVRVVMEMDKRPDRTLGILRWTERRQTIYDLLMAGF